MNPIEITQFMHALCDLAMKETLPRFRSKIDVANKEDEGFDPVTEADKNAERIIRENIIERYPDHGILGEELGTVNEGAEYCWIIDPIDGTRSFISGIPVWGTLIGLYKNNVPLAGIMHQPFTDERYYTNGENSFLRHGGSETMLATRNNNEISDSIILTTTPYLFTKSEMGAYLRLESSCKLPRYGTDCYAYCLLAAGQVDLVVESSLHIYDIAALIPIIQNAGGIITDWQGNNAYHGGQVIAAANENLHQQALTILAKPN